MQSRENSGEAFTRRVRLTPARGALAGITVAVPTILVMTSGIGSASAATILPSNHPASIAAPAQPSAPSPDDSGSTGPSTAPSAPSQQDPVAAAPSTPPAKNEDSPRTSGPKTVYVSPRGTDTNKGTLRSPLHTPQKAVEALGPEGGTVQLAAGKYVKQRIVLDNKKNVTIRSKAGAVLDATGLDIQAEQDLGVVQIDNGSNITIEGLTITGFRTKIAKATPMGIFAQGSIKGLTIRRNHITKMGNDNPGGEKDSEGKPIGMNAFGIGIYGRHNLAPMTSVTVADNEVDNLVLGYSEAVVFNGNIDGFKATGNRIHDNNNNGIDAIGFEQSEQMVPNDRARNGLIANNKVSRILSEHNPAYPKGSNAAVGIYVDGASDTVVENNTVSNGDIGFEVASEKPGGETHNVTVQNNRASGNRAAGISLGGYEADKGEAYGVKVMRNTFRGNNTRGQAAEIHIQHKVHDSEISGNTITVATANSPAVWRVPAAGGSPDNPAPAPTDNPAPMPSDDDTIPTVTSRPTPSDDDTIPTVTSRPSSSPEARRGNPDDPRTRNLVLQNNKYRGPVLAAQAVFHWEGQNIVGFKAWQGLGLDQGSTWRKSK